MAMRSALTLVIAAALLPAIIVADMTEVRMLLPSEAEDCSGSNLLSLAFFGYAEYYAYPNSTASMDELPEFDVCTSGVKPTCSAAGAMTVTEYGSSACDGAATSTEVFSHDVSCVSDAYTVGCSQEDKDFENTYDTFEVIATFYDDDTCSTATGETLTIDNDAVDAYIEASRRGSTSSPATMALAEPLLGLADATDATDASSCVVDSGESGNTTSSTRACVSGVYMEVMYIGEDCSGSPQGVGWIPGCLNTGTADKYTKISCEDSTFDIGYGAPASTPSYLVAFAAGVIIWGFLSSATGVF